MSEQTPLLRSRSRPSACNMCACCTPPQIDYSDFAAEVELHGIEQLKVACAKPLDVNATETAALLQRLWRALQPWRVDAQAPKLCPGSKHPAWKYIGFQADTPLTDVRSAGLLGLQLLVHVAEHSPSALQQAHASATQYPFCAAVLDSAFMMCAALKLLPSLPTFCPATGTNIRTPDTRTRRDLLGFLGLVQASDSPATVLQEVLLATSAQVQVGWEGLKQTMLAGQEPSSLLSPSVAPSSAVSAATSPLATAAAAAAAGVAGDTTPPTAILYFKHALQFARKAVLEALEQQPEDISQFRSAANRSNTENSIGDLTPIPDSRRPPKLN